jgi:hypothetical protein
MPFFEQTQSGRGVVRGDGLETGSLQRERKQVDQLAIVINQQDPH